MAKRTGFILAWVNRIIADAEQSQPGEGFLIPLAWDAGGFKKVTSATTSRGSLLYSDSETAWLDRRALLIRERTGWPLPIARSEAAAEMVRMRQRPPCAVILLPQRRLENGERR